MNGLLGIDDPRTMGLLSLGLRLMSSPGKLGPALGQAGMGALGDVQGVVQANRQRERQAKQDAMQATQFEWMKAEAMRKQAEADRAEKERAAIEAAARGAVVPGAMPVYMDARDIGLPGEMPSIPAKTFDQGRFLDTLRGQYPLKAAEYEAALKKSAPKLESLADGASGYIWDGTRFVKVADNAKDPKNEATGDMKNYGLAVAQGYKGSFNDWLLSQKKAAATNVSVNTTKPLMNELAGGLGKQIDQSLSSARAAQNSITTAHRLMEAVDSGKLVAGPGARFRIFGLQIGQMLGIGGSDGAETLANTRNAIQAMAQAELDAAQQMKGQGQITEAERDIIRRASSGDIESLTAQEVRLLAQALEKTGRWKIKSHQSNVESLKKMPEAAPLLPFYELAEPEPYKTNRVRKFNPATGRIE